MARLLIVGGGCRGRQLAQEVVRCGHAVRIVTRTESGRISIEAAGAECWIGDPDRLGTLRGAFEGVALACWLLGTATGPEEQLRALHGARLRAFVAHMVDTTVRGFVYEAAGSSVLAETEMSAEVRCPPAAVEGERIAREVARANSIPLAFVRADPTDLPRWLEQARAAVDSLLGPPPALGVDLDPDTDTAIL